MKVFVETDRFLMREFLESDVDELFLLESDPEVYRYLGMPAVASKDQMPEMIAYVRQQYVDNGIGRWVVIEKDTGVLVGWSGLKYETVVQPGQPYFDLGYRFRREYWGKGIASETARASLDYGFKVMQLEQICAAAHIENIGSNRVLQKMGMRQGELFHFEGMPHNWYLLDRQDWGRSNPA
ncbi:MAG: GNAT family N-acetyltransferase [Bacteroidota bacterium]